MKFLVVLGIGQKLMPVVVFFHSSQNLLHLFDLILRNYRNSSLNNKSFQTGTYIQVLQHFFHRVGANLGAFILFYDNQTLIFQHQEGFFYCVAADGIELG